MQWLLHLALALLVLQFEAVNAAEGVVVLQDPASPTAQASHVCRGRASVTVHSVTATEAEAACEGARRALEFLASAGLDSPPNTTIEIVQELPGELAGRAVGCYVRETKRILLLSFNAFQSGGGWFRLSPSWELYRAVAAHETAHAVVGCHTEPRRLPVAAHEYVAYVVMFATMDPATRSAVLSHFPTLGPGRAMQISDLHHMVQPNQFGVDAWRDYLRTRDPDAWLRKIIAGEVVPDVVEDPDASAR